MKIAKCRMCGSDVRRNRKWQEFCSDACRWRYWSQNHPRAKNAKPSDPPACFYCGLPASTVDHVPPKNLRDRVEILGLSNRYTFHEVQACFECNTSALGGRAIWTLSARKQFVKRWLRKRYKRLLGAPKWTDREIMELGYMLRTSVLSRQLAAEILRARIDW